jgi:uncharacterized protein YjiS (DUF1127 family)
MTMTATTLAAPAPMRILSGLAALHLRMRAAAKARRLDRAVARLGSLSPHYLDDVGIGDGFGIEGADVVPKPPAMRT